MTGNGGNGAADGSPGFARADPGTLALLSRVPVANIGDAMDRLGIVDSAIKPVWAGARIAGSAYTIWTRSGDNLHVHRAIDLAEPGDVLVVNGGGDTSRALLGELMGTRAKLRGLAGFVVDGAIRDAADLGELGLPVFARAVTPAGPYKNGPGRLLVPIALGGVSVSPGDVIVGDSDGVAVVPLHMAADVARRATEIHENEAVKRAGYYQVS